LADFAVAIDGGHLKIGSASRSERLAKYNRFLEIEMILEIVLKVMKCYDIRL